MGLLSASFNPKSTSTTSLYTSISEREIPPPARFLLNLFGAKLGTFIGSLNFTSASPSSDIPPILGAGGGGGGGGFGAPFFTIFGLIFLGTGYTNADNTAFFGAITTPGRIKAFTDFGFSVKST